MAVEVAPLEPERRVGRRVIRAGDVVRIAGLGRGCVRVDGRFVRGFRVLGFRGAEVHVCGAKSAGRAELLRVFPIERLGSRARSRSGG